MKRLSFFLLLIIALMPAEAQQVITDDGTFTADGYQQRNDFGRSDSIQSQHKEIPRGLKVWTVDERFGDRTIVEPDTMSFMFMNTALNTGVESEYNSLGNLGSPRQNRIFIDREEPSEFLFLDGYNQFITRPDEFHFTSTFSPITNLTYTTAGNRTDGEDHFKALFAINAGKRWGFGFKFDYLYGRGYYSDQAASHFNYSMWGSYLGERYQAHLLLQLNHQKIAENGGITNDAYITHPDAFNESFNEDEIPTMLTRNWNRHNNQHIFFNHRYSLGFYRKVPMTKEEIEARKFAIRSQKQREEEEAKDKARRQAEEDDVEFDEQQYDEQHRSSGRPADAKIMGDAPVAGTKAVADTGRVKVNLQDSIHVDYPEDTTKVDEQWMKREYVPVTSFIHSISFDNYQRIYQAYESPENYYDSTYYEPLTFAGDSIYDKTRHWRLRNTVAVALLEGFNKWAKAGLKAFASYELRHYELPTLDAQIAKYNEHDFSIGAQLLKRQGRLLHYDVSAEAWLVGARKGQLAIDAHGDLNVPLFGDTMRVDLTAFMHSTRPSFYMSTYHSRHFWWDNLDLDKQMHTRLMGQLSLKKTGTTLRVAYDNIKNLAYLGISYDRVLSGTDYRQQHTAITPMQHSGAVSLLTLQLRQKLHWRIIHWDNVLTLQKTSNDQVLPVPTFNVYSNLYLRFTIAKVLKCDLGVDMRFFTKYYAPEYSPQLGQMAIQQTEASRTKIGSYPIFNAYANFFLKHTRFFVMMTHLNSHSGGDYFFVPHYPLNRRIIRFGVSWNFFN